MSETSTDQIDDDGGEDLGAPPAEMTAQHTPGAGWAPMREALGLPLDPPDEDARRVAQEKLASTRGECDVFYRALARLPRSESTPESRAWADSVTAQLKKSDDLEDTMFHATNETAAVDQCQAQGRDTVDREVAAPRVEEKATKAAERAATQPQRPARRRAIVFLDHETIARVLHLPDDLRVVSVGADWARDSVMVMVEGDRLVSTPPMCEHRILSVVWDWNEETGHLRAEVELPRRDDEPAAVAQ